MPWEGRRIEASAYAGDDGRADPLLAAAIGAVRAGESSPTAAIDALRTARVLVPLLAALGEAGDDGRGHVVDKSQELAIVTVAGPDGRAVLPAFTEVATMTAWNPSARPVPVDGVRLAAAAVGEETDVIVLDPGSDRAFVVRRPAVWAIAAGEPWRPSFDDDEVLSAFRASIAPELAVQEVALDPGDPVSSGAGPELAVRLTLSAGLTADELEAITSRLAARWAADDVIATRVDSLAVQLVAAPLG